MDWSVRVFVVSFASLAHLPTVLSDCRESPLYIPLFRRLLRSETGYQLLHRNLFRLVWLQISNTAVIHSYISVTMPCARQFGI